MAPHANREDGAGVLCLYMMCGCIDGRSLARIWEAFVCIFLAGVSGIDGIHSMPSRTEAAIFIMSSIKKSFIYYQLVNT